MALLVVLLVALLVVLLVVLFIIVVGIIVGGIVGGGIIVGGIIVAGIIVGGIIVFNGDNRRDKRFLYVLCVGYGLIEPGGVVPPPGSTQHGAAGGLRASFGPVEP